MHVPLSRRQLLATGAALPLLALPGCASGLGGFGFEEALRRLLTLSSQRAFATLLQENGFFQDEIAQIQLPAELGGSGAAALLAALLRSPPVQQQLLRLVNAAAAEGARAAAPIVLDSIRGMSFVDARNIVRGGSTAATEYLQRRMGNALFDTMLPGIGNALRTLDTGILGQALRAATGIDIARLQYDVTRKASAGIYRAIGREEAAIRANPRATGDAVLGVFGLLG